MPKKWKLMLVTWMIIYPLLNLLLWILGPYLPGLHPLLRTLILTVIIVPTLTLVLPKVHKLLHAWLRK